MAFTSEYMVEIEEAQKLERDLAQSKEANAGLMRSCDYLERELGEVTKQRDTLSEALTEIEQYDPISGNRFAIKSEFYWLAHKALSATKGGNDE
jgi:hypothetical protein